MSFCDRRLYLVLFLVIVGAISLVAIFFLFDLYEWADGADEKPDTNNCVHDNSFLNEENQWQCFNNYNGNYLRVVNLNNNWQSAEDFCLNEQQQDAQLVSISNQDQENIIKELIKEQANSKEKCEHYWLGANWDASTQTFQWADGKKSIDYLKKKLNMDFQKYNESVRIVISSKFDWKIFNKNSQACFICGWDAKLSASSATDCNDLKLFGKTRSGIYSVKNVETNQRQKVLCEMKASDGGWTVFQQRFTGKLSFWNQKWMEYRNGFGQIGYKNEFWAGNELIHQLTTKHKNVKLRVELYGDRSPNATMPNGYWESEYENFWIGDEASNYTLHINATIPATTGNASAAWFDITFGNDFPFSTIDHINDPMADCVSNYHLGGWWLHYCTFAALNGEYNPPFRWSDGYGMMWVLHGREIINPRQSRMMIRGY